MTSSSSGLKGPPLTWEEVVGFVRGVDERSVLSLTSIWIPLEAEDPKSAGSVAVGACFPILVRSHGLMLLIPKSDEIQTAILHASSESQVEPVFWDSEVTVVSSRSKVLGLAECQLVDLGWEAISSFFKSTVLRGAAARNTRVVHFQVGDQSGRPSASSALRLAETWLGEGAGLDAEVTADYHTGVEYEESDVLSPSLAANGDQGEVAQLKERMRALEAELARARQPVIPPRPSTVPLLPGAKHGAEQRLFGTQPASSGLNSEELMKLQQLAGTPPGRLGAAVQRQSLTDVSNARGSPCRGREGCHRRSSIARTGVGLGTGVGCRPHSTDVASDEAELCFDATHDGAQRSNVYPAKRRGQRVRKQLRKCQRVHGQRHVPEDSSGSSQGRRSRSVECHAGIGHLDGQ